MKFLIIAVSLFISTSTFAAKRSCEDGLSTAALRFVRLIPSALRNGTITVEDLRWMIAQPKPSNPVRSSRRAENLSQKNGFERELPRITPDQWRLVVARATEIELEHLGEKVQVENARESTKNVFSIFRTDYEFRDAGVIEHFISSRGEVFVCTRSPDHSHVHNLTTGTQFKIDSQTADHGANDFFETSNGEVLFTLLSRGSLTVHNARTGERLAFVDLADVDGANRMTPLMYEENGIPTIVIGMTNVNITEPFALIAMHKVQVLPGIARPRLRAYQEGQVTRLKDGHLYHYKYPEDEIVLTDLSLGKEVLRLKNSKGDYFGSRMALIDSHGPRFLFQLVGDPNNLWSILDTQSNSVIPTDYSANASDIRTLFDFKGEAISIQTLDAPNLKLAITRIVKNEVTTVDIPSRSSQSRIWNFPQQYGVDTPVGTFALLGEWTPRASPILHLYNLDANYLLSLPVPSELNNINGIYYDRADGRIKMFGRTKTDRTYIYQIYGPEKRHQ